MVEPHVTTEQRSAAQQIAPPFGPGGFGRRLRRSLVTYYPVRSSLAPCRRSESASAAAVRQWATGS